MAQETSVVDRSKYKRLHDLYVAGQVVEFDESLTIWMQALNPFEMDEARHDAQTARARLTMALREHGSDELAKVESAFYAMDRDEAIATLADARAAMKLPTIFDDLQSDEEWAERLEIMERSQDIIARPPEDSERALLTKANEDYLGEVDARLKAEREDLERGYVEMDEAQLLKEFIDLYIERRGGDRAQAEFNLTQAWYGARVCEGKKDANGEWDHSPCDGHRVQIWPEKAEVRDLPEQVLTAMVNALDEIAVSVREGKGSGSQASSSDSSAQPARAEGSTVSTQEATPGQPLGVSS